MRRVVALALLALANAGLAGCAEVAQATRPATEAVGRLLLSPEEEKRIGDQLSAQVRQQEGVVQDPEVQAYLREVGQVMVQAVPEKDRRFDYTFTVLDAPDSVNAFALPGGHIFVNSGLLKAVDSEAELASVLGHEIAHITLDHPSQQLAAQVGLGTLQQLALGSDPALVAQLGSAIVAQGYLAAHSREAERDADRIGLSYLTAANYSPAAMPRFFSQLAAMNRSDPNFVQDFFATHPAPGERATTLEAMIAEQHLAPGRQQIVGNLPQMQQRLGGTAR